MGKRADKRKRKPVQPEPLVERLTPLPVAERAILQRAIMEELFRSGERALRTGDTARAVHAYEQLNIAAQSWDDLGHQEIGEAKRDRDIEEMPVRLSTFIRVRVGIENATARRQIKERIQQASRERRIDMPPEHWEQQALKESRGMAKTYLWRDLLEYWEVWRLRVDLPELPPSK